MSQIANPPELMLVPMDEDLGPAMRDLTTPQKAFVMAYAEQGGVNGAEAARRAGYGGNSNSQKVAASNLLRQPRILAALREVADARLKSGAILAASVLIEIAGDPLAKDRYKAANDLLNRAGLVVEGVSRVIVEDHRDVGEIERRIRDLAERLGIDPDRLIGQSQVEDIDYEEVKADGLEAAVVSIHDQGDEWQQGQKDLDALLERSE